MAGRSVSAGVFFSSDSVQRMAFQALCGEMFAQLNLAEQLDQVVTQLGQRQPDLLVLDLNGYQYLNELAGIGTLIRSRAGAPVLVLCPYDHTAWLPELMTFGQFEYRICPLIDDELRQAVAQALSQPVDAAAALQQQLLDKEKELRDVLGVQRSLQRALASIEPVETMAAHICLALCNFPGVRHTAVLHLKERGDLQLLAQESRNHLDLTRLLQRRDRLLQSPLRDIFPPLLSVVRGELMLLDAPEKAGNPEFAMALHDRGVRMVLSLPLRAAPGGPEIGAICLMFDRHIMFSREQFACFNGLAQIISFAMGMSALQHQNEELNGQLSQMSTVDTLTGAANRRAGEEMLDHELRRARRYGIALAVLSFDVVGFQSDNDIYGSSVGDAVLRSVAAIVKERLRTSDLLARMQGEQFIVIATHTNAVDAMRLAEKLRQAIMEADLPSEATVVISLSVSQTRTDDGVATVLERLDLALQRAKRVGRCCIELAD